MSNKIKTKLFKNVVQELKESVVLPVKHRDMFHNSSLYSAPKGVLLHGPPGKIFASN